MRAISRELRIHRITVARKKKFLAEQSLIKNQMFLEPFKDRPIQIIQMDELETFEYTKCKPLSVALAVSDEPGTKRLILGYEISVMPAKGPLAEISRKKYGFRRDFRSEGLSKLFKKVAPYVHLFPNIKSDQNPRYPSVLKKYWPIHTHIAVKGRRGCITGQGELKKVGFDPLFSLNHTCAMLRAHVSRLIRRTWGTTKKVEALREHLEIYMLYHNTVLLKGKDS